jgi:hypothetical protein
VQAVSSRLLRMDAKRDIGDSTADAEKMNPVPDRSSTSIENLGCGDAARGDCVFVDAEEPRQVGVESLQGRVLRN